MKGWGEGVVDNLPQQSPKLTNALSVLIEGSLSL